MDKEMQGLLAGSEEEMFNNISDGISDYIHGPARDQIAEALASTEDLVTMIAETAYQILHDVSGQVAEVSPEMVTLDLLLPLATETLDYLIEIAEAVGRPLGDLTDLREDTLSALIAIHMEVIGDDPEQKAIAQEMLAEFMEDGTFDEAAQYFDDRVKARGGDPEEMRMMGAQMAAPQQNQLSAGIQQGLLG